MAFMRPLSFLPSPHQGDLYQVNRKNSVISHTAPSPSAGLTLAGLTLRRRSGIVGGYLKRHSRRFIPFQFQPEQALAFPSQSISLSHQFAGPCPLSGSPPGSPIQTTLNFDSHQSKDKKPNVTSRAIDLTIRLTDPYVIVSGLDPELDQSLSQFGGDDESTAGLSEPAGVVRGWLHLKARHRTKIRSLRLRFGGTSSVLFPPFFRPENVPSATSFTRAVNTDTISVFKHDFPVIISCREGEERVIEPGDYWFPFSVNLPNSLPESANTDLGEVRYSVDVLAELARLSPIAGCLGTKRLEGSELVNVIRAPSPQSDPGCLIPEPISLSKNWKDIVQYDLLIHGRVFIAGSIVPIDLTFAPLNKMAYCHSIKVELVERVVYKVGERTSEKEKTTRLLTIRNDAIRNDEQRGVMMSTLFPGSTTTVKGIGLSSLEEAYRAYEGKDSSSRTDHLLGRTRCELGIQLPACREGSASIAKLTPALRMNFGVHHDTSSIRVQVRHSIRTALRVSYPRSRVGTISEQMKVVDVMTESPIHILSCLADPIQWSLPAYDEPYNPSGRENQPPSPSDSQGPNQFRFNTLQAKAATPCACRSLRSPVLAGQDQLIVPNSFIPVQVQGSATAERDQLPSYERPPPYSYSPRSPTAI